MPTKILAIDDSKTMRLAIKITFAAEDAEVTSVSKGSDAVARAGQVGADVVIVDHKLGDGEPSGYDVCRALKGDATTSSIPVLLLVSNQAGADQAAIASAGADGWLAKPFDTQELVDKVADLLQNKGARPAATAGAAKPIAAPPSAGPASTRPPVAAARPAATPAAAPRPAATVAKSASPAPAAAPSRPAATPAAAAPAAARPTARTQMGMPTPAPKSPPASPGARGDGVIPIAIPIPFTAASAPTASMLARLQAAAGTAGVDPKVAEAIANLSREVIERVVWEVVPELAESIIKKESQARSA
jgi:CheY-like chemotaxis protein